MLISSCALDVDTNLCYVRGTWPECFTGVKGHVGDKCWALGYVYSCVLQWAAPVGPFNGI